jgi:hypothetical protein
MTCKLCGSYNQRKVGGEIAIHIPGLKGIEKPPVWVFTPLLVCVNCGATEFLVPEAQRRVLANDAAAAAAGF